jgi:hypothetical protein
MSQNVADHVGMPLPDVRLRVGGMPRAGQIAVALAAVRWRSYAAPPSAPRFKSILRKLRARDRTHAVAISLGMATDIRSGDSGMAGHP